MLGTRLWMGSLLVVLALGMLFLDQHLAPYYPFLLVFQLCLALTACIELIALLGPGRRPLLVLSVLGVVGLACMNWLAHMPLFEPDPWNAILGCYTAIVLAIMLWEMTVFVEASRAIERMGRTLLIVSYLGLLPCFFAQLRWLYADPVKCSAALALAIFVPKCCDIGAYCTGRLLGRHPMTPILSPKKTWEGAIGGWTFACLIAIGIDRLGPAPLLNNNLVLEIAFGLVIGTMGMLGDLAESLIKRDCQQKDASQIIPGFGGVLDVIDAVIFSAPLTYVFLSVID